MNEIAEFIGVAVGLISMAFVAGKTNRSRRIGFWLGAACSVFWAVTFAYSGLKWLALYSTVRCILGLKGVKNNRVKRQIGTGKFHRAYRRVRCHGGSYLEPIPSDTVDKSARQSVRVHDPINDLYG